MDENTNKKRKVNLPLLIVEILILIIALIVLFFVLKTTRNVEHTELDRENITVNDEVIESAVEEETVELGYRNIALFGVDSREGDLGQGTRSDTIIICSVNQDTKEIKLVSVYRDTYLNLGNDSYNKCNSAYAQGGPEQAISMLNTNLDLNITDYVTVGFGGLIDAIDSLGGIDIDVTEDEITHLNNYQICMADELGMEYIPVETAGRQHLNGLQGTAYCRIRYTKGDDFKRAERQRNVLISLMLEAKQASIGELNGLVDAILPQIQTSLDIDQIVAMLGDVADYNIVTSQGFPFRDMLAGETMGKKGSCVIPTSLEGNVVRLHQDLYGNEGYVASETVQRISTEIENEAEEFASN